MIMEKNKMKKSQLLSLATHNCAVEKRTKLSFCLLEGKNLFV